MKLNKLDWDSDFFNLKIGSIEIENTKSLNIELLKALELEYDLIYVRGKGLSINDDTLNNFGGFKVDTKLVYQWSVLPQNVDLDQSIHIYQPDTVTKELRNLAIQSGVFSRFKTDQNFQNGMFEELYSKWIKNSVLKVNADFVFVKEVNTTVVGFVTLKLDNKNKWGNIGLIAVDKNYRGQRIGQKLINKVKSTLHQNKFNCLKVATQLDNNVACKFYETNGFSIYSQIEIFHFWLKNSTYENTIQ